MKPEVDLVSVDGRALVPAVKKRKANEVFTDVVPVENAPILKSVQQFSNNFLTSVSQVFRVFLPKFYSPFYSLFWVGVVMSVNATLSIFFPERNIALIDNDDSI